MKQYNFHLTGERGMYEVAFSIDENNIQSACTCNYVSEKKICWHRCYILAGKQQRIPAEEYQAQKELLFHLSKTHGGRELVSYAKASFGEKETCRRCNKSDVLDVKKSFAGTFVSLFIPKGRRYFCWSCRWSW